ncbi:hypothetical protein H8356DRAFT_1426776 [Neocallimastix lanati (nom. inval.)]|nr:hypothetical protein H8356DRAFT_1426776 [Neocallimastix sp. JGI-2020a]
MSYLSDIDINSEEEFEYYNITKKITGVGKSTLINSIFHENGTRKSITQEIKEFSKEGYPISILETEGLDIIEYEKSLDDLENYIKKRKGSPNKNEQIHVAWVCISELSYRFMRADEAIIEKLLECEIPVIVVLCKLLSMNDTTGLKEVIMKRFEYVSGVIVLNIVNYNTYTLKPFNLENLVILTNEVLDEGMRNAFIASQKIDLRFKKERAVKTVIASSSNSKIKSIKDLPNVCIDMITEITEERDKISKEEASKIIETIGERYIDVLISSFITKNNKNEYPLVEEILALINNENSNETLYNRYEDKILNNTDSLRWTALHWASYFGYVEIVKILLERGIDPNIRTKEGIGNMYKNYKAKEIANLRNNTKVEKILTKHKLNTNIKNIKNTKRW